MDEQNLNPQGNNGVGTIKKNHFIFFVFCFIFLAIFSVFGYWFFKNKPSYTKVDTQAKNQDTIVENNNAVTDFVFPNLKYLSDSEEEKLGMIMRCNYINNRDYLKYFPATWQKEWAEDLKEIDAEVIEDMQESGISKEESEAKFKKCFTYYSAEDLAFVDYLVKTDKDKDGLNLYVEYLKNSNDNKSDTDDDGFDDLTEFESGHDINNNLAEENLARWRKVAEALSAPSPDLEKVKDLCADLGRWSRDNCLKALYWYGEDEIFCEEFKYYDDVFSDSHGELCRSIVRGRKAYVPEKPEICLELGETYEQSICLAQSAIAQHSLDACRLGYDFNECAEVRGVFDSLGDSQKCIDRFADLSSIIAFNGCLYDTTVLDGNISNCYYMQTIEPYQCILKALGANKSICDKYQGTWDELQIIDELRCKSTNPKLFRAFLGVYDENMTVDIAKQNKMVFVGGSLVLDVVPLGPADRAGIKKGDVITEINGVKININNDLRKALSKYVSNDEIEIKVLSDGAYKKLKITFLNVHDAYYNSYGDMIYNYEYPYWDL